MSTEQERAARVKELEEADVQARDILHNCTQLIDVTRQEWIASGDWSEWDQSVRDSITAWLRQHYARNESSRS